MTIVSYLYLFIVVCLWFHTELKVLPTAYTDGLHRRTKRSLRSAHLGQLRDQGGGRDYHDCVRLHYHLLAQYHKVFKL